MMRNMVVRDVVQEVSPLPAQEGSVDRAARATQEGPGTLSEVGQSGIGVLELDNRILRLELEPIMED